MDENKRLIGSFFKHFSAGRISEAFALVDDDVAWWVPGTLVFSGTKSKTEYMQIVGRIGAAFPGGLKLT
ncbi:MAG: nuclear transport factor 2 family protein, partial [Candidatus Binatia bacterium]